MDEAKKTKEIKEIKEIKEGKEEKEVREEEKEVREEKKPDLSKVPETLLQPLCARAQYSRKQNAKFRDQKAEEIAGLPEPDISWNSKYRAMSAGTAARTIAFDLLVRDFIDKHQNAVIVNLGCGMDTRYYRVDNGKIHWYDIDLPDVIGIRKQFFQESDRCFMIGCSVTDPDWAKEVWKKEAPPSPLLSIGKRPVRKKQMLFLIEGLTMYLSADQVGKMLGNIRDTFPNATVFMECMSPYRIKKQEAGKSEQGSGPKLLWGADSFEDMGDAAEGFENVEDSSILKGMEALHPGYRLIDWMPLVKRSSQKILIFRKKVS